jgi:hypothetical protein
MYYTLKYWNTERYIITFLLYLEFSKFRQCSVVTLYNRQHNEFVVNKQILLY